MKPVSALLSAGLLSVSLVVVAACRANRPGEEGLVAFLVVARHSFRCWLGSLVRHPWSTGGARRRCKKGRQDGTGGECSFLPRRPVVCRQTAGDFPPRDAARPGGYWTSAGAGVTAAGRGDAVPPRAGRHPAVIPGGGAGSKPRSACPRRRRAGGQGGMGGGGAGGDSGKTRVRGESRKFREAVRVSGLRHLK